MNIWVRRFSILLPGALVAFAVVASTDDQGLQQMSPGKRVAPETATVGLTAEQYMQRQAQLHDWLESETPGAALVNPVRIQLSQQELNEVNNPEYRPMEPLRVGVVKGLDQPIAVSCQPASGRQAASCHGGGVLEMTDDGGFIWARSVTSAGAVGIRVHIVDLSLPDDADLYFYGPNGEAYGPYRSYGPNGDGDFWLPSVLADTGTIVVRHFGPGGGADLPQLRMAVNEIGHIGEGLLDGEPSPDSLCSYNASCVENATCGSTGPAPAGNSSAVAKMLWVAGCCIHICTGGLIADTDGSSEIPYFLTANHCLSKNNAANNLEAFFQYHTSCNSPDCSVGSFQAPNTPKTTGSSIEKTSQNGDYTLLRLDQNPPAGTTFLGWNSTPIAFSNGAALHRISHPSGAPQAYSEHAVDTGIGTCLNTPRGEFIYSDDVIGATEGGSSGAPVVNASGEIVGQLTGCCGVGGGNCNDVCNANNHTIDGAFAFYFSSVESILDPGPSGCTPTTASCNDGVDNDCDGATDCNDTGGGAEDCTGDPSCNSGCANPGGAPPGTPCTSNAECCSNKCKGPPNNHTCR